MTEKSQSNLTTVRFKAVTPQFTVSDLVRTAEYYRDILGFQIAGYWEEGQVTHEPQSPVFAIVWRDDVQVFFNRAEQSEVRTGRAPDGYDAFFHIAGVDEFAAQLRDRGAEIIDGPDTRVYDQRELVVRDCNGLILCFAEDVGRQAK